MTTTHVHLPWVLSRRRATAGPPRWDARVLAHLRAWHLDRELAAGTPSWSSRYHASRSLQLTAPRRRRATARALEQLTVRAEQPRAWSSATIMPCREQVRAALPIILVIAERLRSAEPVSSCGMAELLLLMGDGGGPCYARLHPDALTEALEAAAVDLEAAGG